MNFACSQQKIKGHHLHRPRGGGRHSSLVAHLGRLCGLGATIGVGCVPSGYVKIAIEHGHL